jgi:hypothetical protein
MRLRHPQVGELELRREKLPLSDSGGQILAIYHAELGSDSARALELLGSLAATEAQESERSAQTWRASGAPGG